MIGLQKVKELAMDIDVSLRITDVDTGAYIEAAKEKTALLIAELEKPVKDDLVNIAARWVSNETDIALLACDIKQYAESRCHACPKLKNALGTHTSDRDSEIDNIAEKE